VLLRCRFWTDSRRANVLAVGSEARRRVKEAFDREKIFFTAAVSELSLKVANAKAEDSAPEPSKPEEKTAGEPPAAIAPPTPPPEAVSQAKTEKALPKKPSPESQ
jgi:hypothetical protein